MSASMSVRARARQAGTGALLAFVLCAPLQAQSGGINGSPEMTGSQRWIWAVVGAAVASIPAYFSDQSSVKGICGSPECTATIAGATGGLVGFMIGRERDQLAAQRARWGPPLSVRSRAVGLRLVPESVTPYGDGASIAGQAGAAIVSRDWDVSLRAGRIRGITATIGVPAHDALLAATGSGLFAFPLNDNESSGRMVRPGGVRALAALGESELLLAGAAVLRRVRLSGTGAGLTVADVAETPIAAEVSAVALDPSAKTLWSVEDARLVAREPQALTEIGSAALPSLGRSLSLDGARAAVAAGSDGVYILDIADPAAPALLGTATGFQFAYDALLDGPHLYVAAGQRGLLMADVSDPANAVLVGSGRQFGFAIDLARDAAGRILVVDRLGRTLHVIDLQREARPAATLP